MTMAILADNDGLGVAMEVAVPVRGAWLVVVAVAVMAGRAVVVLALRTRHVLAVVIRAAIVPVVVTGSPYKRCKCNKYGGVYKNPHVGCIFLDVNPTKCKSAMCPM